MKKFFTMGYGGRDPGDFVKLLKKKGVKAVVDVRLRPDKASMGVYANAKSPEEPKGKVGLKDNILEELKSKLPEEKLSKLKTLKNKEFTKDDFATSLKALDFNSEEIKITILHSQKGIRRIFEVAGIKYYPFIELGNPFLDFENDWRERCKKLLENSGELLTERLETIPEPFCLICSEKKVTECHREQLSDYLVKKKGWKLVEHIE